MISKAMIEKAMEARKQVEATLLAMPKEVFEAERADVIRKASRQNADAMWISLKVTMEKIAFLRDGGTIEEYREKVLKPRIAAARKQAVRS